MDDNHKTLGRRTDPSIPISDPRFVYVPASKTDIRATFDRARVRIALAGAANVQPMRRAK